MSANHATKRSASSSRAGRSVTSFPRRTGPSMAAQNRDKAGGRSRIAARVPRRRDHRHPPPTSDPEAELRAQGPWVETAHEDPLYTEADVRSELAHFRGVRYAADVAIADGVAARFVDAGHILGSAIIEVRAQGRTVVFSGDIGRRGTPIVRDPTVLSAAGYVLMESTYGGREHEPHATNAQGLAQTCAPSPVLAAGSPFPPSRSGRRTTWSTS